MTIPPFLRELREIIGKRFILVASVTAAIFDERDRMLVVRITGRTDEFWTFPGGIIEPDERPIEAVVREVQEETGLDVEAGPVIGVFGGPEFRHTYSSGDQAGYVMSTYLCDITGGALQTDGDEIAELRWVGLDDALALPSGPWFPIVVRAAFDAHALHRKPFRETNR